MNLETRVNEAGEVEVTRAQIEFWQPEQLVILRDALDGFSLNKDCPSGEFHLIRETVKYDGKAVVILAVARNSLATRECGLRDQKDIAHLASEAKRLEKHVEVFMAEVKAMARLVELAEMIGAYEPKNKRLASNLDSRLERIGKSLREGEDSCRENAANIDGFGWKVDRAQELAVRIAKRVDELEETLHKMQDGPKRTWWQRIFGRRPAAPLTSTPAVQESESEYEDEE